MGYIGVQPEAGFTSGLLDRFTSQTGSTVTLTHDISSENDIIVFVNFVKQDSTNYSVGGSGNKTLTLGGTLVSSDIVEVHYLNIVKLTQQPSANSVGITELNLSEGTSGQALTTNGSGTLSFSSVGGSNTPIFCARESGQQTINHNTTTNLTFGTEEVDTDSAFASSQFTVPSGKGGLYYLEAQVNYYDAQSNITQGTLWIWKGSNSTKLSNLYTQTDDGANTSHRSLQVSVIHNLSAGDVVGCAGLINTSDSGSLTSYGGDNGTRFMGFKLIQ